MDANQLTEALARAVEAAKPAAEYCFLAKQDHWWTVCMTKAEWSGWMQAIGAVVALAIAIYLPHRERLRSNREARVFVSAFAANLIGILVAVKKHVDTAGIRVVADSARLNTQALLTMAVDVRVTALPMSSLTAYMRLRTAAGEMDEFFADPSILAVTKADFDRLVESYLEQVAAALNDFSRGINNGQPKAE